MVPKESDAPVAKEVMRCDNKKSENGAMQQARGEERRERESSVRLEKP